MFNLFLEVLRHYMPNLLILGCSILLALTLMIKTMSDISHIHYKRRKDRTLNFVINAVIKKLFATSFALFPLFIFDYWAWVYVACSLISITALHGIVKEFNGINIRDNVPLCLTARVSGCVESIPYIVVSLLTYQWARSNPTMEVFMVYSEIKDAFVTMAYGYSLVTMLRGLFKILRPPTDTIFANLPIILGK